MTSIQKEGAEDNNKQVYTIISIPDDLWNKIRKILPKEKPPKTVGRPIIVPYRKVLDGILYVLRTDVSGRCYPENMVPPVSVLLFALVLFMILSNSFSNALISSFSKLTFCELY